jgi:single-strand DNA-binding protein
MNKVILIGNLTRDPEARKTNGGISTTSFTLAVEREQSKKDREDGIKKTDFITVIT